MLKYGRNGDGVGDDVNVNAFTVDSIIRASGQFVSANFVFNASMYAIRCYHQRSYDYIHRS